MLQASSARTARITKHVCSARVPQGVLMGHRGHSSTTELA